MLRPVSRPGERYDVIILEPLGGTVAAVPALGVLAGARRLPLHAGFPLLEQHSLLLLKLSPAAAPRWAAVQRAAGQSATGPV